MGLIFPRKFAPGAGKIPDLSRNQSSRSGVMFPLKSLDWPKSKLSLPSISQFFYTLQKYDSFIKSSILVYIASIPTNQMDYIYIRHCHDNFYLVDRRKKNHDIFLYKSFLVHWLYIFALYVYMNMKIWLA